MASSKRNFIAGRMNKSVDERLVPNGEYVDAMNVRLGSTEDSDIGSVENSKGNSLLATVTIAGQPLSANARCIGAFEDGVNETIYWFIHDSLNTATATDKADLIVSFNTKTETLKYHVVSFKNSLDVTNTTLNFNPQFLINNVNKVGDLLFFTDNYNPPRRINVNKSYGYATSITGVDEFSAEDILVIVKPPSYTPSILALQASEENTFMHERFICFAYRYRYSNNEYSATSQFTNPVFSPKPFSLNPDTFLNEGMVNSTDSSTVTYNTGGKDVVAIDILFKESASNTIKVIESINKKESNISNDVTQDYTFEDSKIFTILSSSEILRLYDNVPLKAKTQTVMGNRVMYGNYIEGYDLKRGTEATRLDYRVEHISNEIGSTSVTPTLVTTTYPVAGNAASLGKFSFFMGSLGFLDTGSVISISFSIKHSSFHAEASNTEPEPTQTTPKTDVSFEYTLINSYLTVAELVSSLDFQEKIGTFDNIKAAPLAEDGSTFTDIINAATPQELGFYDRLKSGINVVPSPIIVTGTDTSLTLTNITMAYSSDVDNAQDSNTFYELYDISDIYIELKDTNDSLSLHSNRGYEVAIIYVDEFNRATTALVSNDNNIHVPCKASDVQNKLKVTIPTTQKAPNFAKRYKFAVKPDAEGYETIYSLIYFNEELTNYTYFKLEGENAAKVEEGDRYIVKRSSSGVPNGCAYATVLSKESLAEGDIQTGIANLTTPEGVYMKILNSDFAAEYGSGSYISPGLQSERNDGGIRATLSYSGFEKSEVAGVMTNYQIPLGSNIKVTMDLYRNQKGNCDYWSYKYDRTFSSSQNYNDILEWWDGDNIALTLGGGNSNGGASMDYSADGFESGTGNTANCFMYKTATSDEIKFIVRGFSSCDSYSGGSSNIKVSFSVVLSNGAIVFETLPIDSLPDVWYEGQDSYPISEEGYHESNIGGDINQTSSVNAELTLGFHNCYTFGNGVESYKIRDSIKGKAMRLGNRVTTVSEQDYKQAKRSSDITYSGVFNDETNINRLNEFNLGLSNFKPLENSFGPINKMFARETDILTLQEDKVSYVLSSKGLLTDSSGGGILTSVPEVLGQQIARVEDFGISDNAESFTSYGSSKFFTDSKRGAVIQLKGSSASNESLNVISELGMRSWFRDLFSENFNTQKLGAFDPYMNEYVLSSNNIDVPKEEFIYSCGSRNQFTTDAISDSGVFSYKVDLGNDTGQVDFDVNVVSTEGVTVDIEWNGVTVATQLFAGEASQVMSFTKDLISPNQVTVTITNTDITATTVVEIESKCPTNNPLKVVAIVLTNNEDSGKSLHRNWAYTIGTQTNYSTLQVVNFYSSINNTYASSYKSYLGIQGQGSIPASGAEVSMWTLKTNTDTYDISNDPSVLPNDTFRWLVTDVDYSNNESDLNTLLPLTASITPSGAEPSYNAYFNVGAITGADKVLYLVWDLRKATESFLCFDADTTSVGLNSVCCECSCTESTTTYRVDNSGTTTITITYNSGVDSVVLLGDNYVDICSNSYPSYTPASAFNVSISTINCDC
jgi:hypothetical protein